jgi:putative YhdH/YhfP family quinone oxidoreductase
MNDEFRAYMIEARGDTVRPAFVQMKPDQLDAGDVTVRVHYASVNYKDALAASGRGKIIRRFPCVGGIDAAGVVESSGSTRFRPGDEVIVHSHGFGVSHHGGYAEWARVPADWVNAVPAGLTPLDAITIGVAGYTAALAIDLMELNECSPARGKVLVNGATGGVASVAIDILAQRGWHVVAATGKPQESQYLLDLGAKEIIAASEAQAGSRPLESVRWAAALDSLGGKPLESLIRTVGKDGVIASFGNAAGIEFSSTVMPFILRGLRLVGVNSDNEPALRERIWQRLATDLRPKHLDSIRRVRPFEELPQVVEDLIAGRNRGRAVIDLRG